MKSLIVGSYSERELEMLANLESALKKLAQAQDYISFLGGCNESIKEIQTELEGPNHYLAQYGIVVPVFKYEGKELEGQEG